MAVILKIASSGGVDEIRFAEIPSFDALQFAIRSLPRGQKCVAKYTDEDGDQCTLLETTYDDFLITAKEQVADSTVLTLQLAGDEPCTPESDAKDVARMPSARTDAKEDPTTAELSDSDLSEGWECIDMEDVMGDQAGSSEDNQKVPEDSEQRSPLKSEQASDVANETRSATPGGELPPKDDSQASSGGWFSKFFGTRAEAEQTEPETPQVEETEKPEAEPEKAEPDKAETPTSKLVLKLTGGPKPADTAQVEQELTEVAEAEGSGKAEQAFGCDGQVAEHVITAGSLDGSESTECTKLPCHVCKGAIHLHLPSPFRNWQCDLCLREGFSEFDPMWGCSTATACNWGICMDCYDSTEGVAPPPGPSSDQPQPSLSEPCPLPVVILGAASLMLGLPVLCAVSKVIANRLNRANSQRHR